MYLRFRKKTEAYKLGPLGCGLDFLNSVHLYPVFHFDISQIDYWNFGYAGLFLEHLGHYYRSYIGEYGISLYAGDRIFELLCPYYNLTVKKTSVWNGVFNLSVYSDSGTGFFEIPYLCRFKAGLYDRRL